MNRFLGIFLIILCSGLTACSTLPEAPPATPSTALSPGGDGALAALDEEITNTLAEDQTALMMVADNEDAMNLRLALIDSATSSIDAQYFIWKDDPSASLALEHVLEAADRGVRVRLLVDDMFLSTTGPFKGADEALAALDFHDNIEIRLFNPGKYRDGILGLAGNFGSTLKTYNRRMHNKLLVVDGRFTMLGGRNIADEYFGLYAPYNFLDLDVLAAGAAVGDASNAYDEYWNSDLAYPVTALDDAGQQDLDDIRKLNREYVEENSGILSSYPAAPTDWSELLESLPQTMTSATAIFLQDEPVQRGDEQLRLYDMLNHISGPGDKEMIIISPYLIPVGDFLELIAEDVAAGVDVKLLTNSLGSNDATAAHSHYKKYRHKILDTGAELYESHHQPGEAVRSLADVEPNEAGFVGLHIKSAVVDNKKCFIGSLNLDPRAVVLNTENGLYVESEEFCSELRDFLSGLLEPENAWKVERSEDGDLQWTSYEGTVDQQPAQGTGQRVSDFFFRMLPVESQL